MSVFSQGNVVHGCFSERDGTLPGAFPRKGRSDKTDLPARESPRAPFRIIYKGFLDICEWVDVLIFDRNGIQNC